ncbi:GNAT family N-acetyltransferase [Photobacterium gaetbulicola]|uniref:BioF2-like acetyltransferase domain-containing protein n=2 Tax=Photobacterium gaetbulicola TaxID=1295392 RepID=A0A0C5X165_9GAMM|nr:GNAT family N-acetyltransferase [Photobacterium gaetbulicola]AJR09070.1 hypothetical protein H744_2c2407 [Photobacterium gaetbulicola Gung47]KHT64180.1 hypothetical protein RJ45_07840 [Photobacterium gaetbulicola]PSU04810.1 GNAT family N-acetyltransferase [Photobacterium gaetbulicola]
MNRQNNAIDCELYFCPDREWLQQAWTELEARSEPNIFLSWLWIGSWFNSLVGDYYVVEAKINNEVVGLGVIITRTDSYYRFFRGVPCYLHRIGDELSDQAWIEYNDFLMVKGQEDSIRHEMITTVMQEIVGNGKFIVGASHSEVTATMLDNYGIESIWESYTYQIDLELLRDQNKTLSEAISRSARYQIMRSIRLYQEYGELKVSTADSVEEALAYFEMAKPMHIQRWGDQLGQSGFCNPQFTRFHEMLIRSGVPLGHVRLHKITAGNELISIMYNFHWHGRVTFYLSALNYDLFDKHLKPGMVSHFMLINMAMEQGFSRYDFMAGTARYKRTFANSTSSLYVYEMRKSKSLLALKNKLRYVKHQLSEWR